MARYVICPFFRHEKKTRSVACEDTYHTFERPEDKYAWMDAYCCSEWMECLYARDLDDAYTRIEEGDERALEHEKIEAMEKEMRRLSTLIGKQARKIEAREDEIKELRKKNKILDNQKESFQGRVREQMARIAALDKKVDHLQGKGLASIESSLMKMKASYEMCLCYLIAKHEGGSISDQAACEWEKEQNGKPRILIVKQEDGTRTFTVIMEKDNETDGSDEQKDEKEEAEEGEKA